MVVSVNGPITSNQLVLDLQGGPNTAQFDALQLVMRDLFEKVKELASDNQSQHRALIGASNELVSRLSLFLKDFHGTCRLIFFLIFFLDFERLFPFSICCRVF